jgi:hypothetical protein
MSALLHPASADADMSPSPDNTDVLNKSRRVSDMIAPRQGSAKLLAELQRTANAAECRMADSSPASTGSPRRNKDFAKSRVAQMKTAI